MAKNKNKFEKAIRESLEQLQNHGLKKITKSEIIQNAKFEDGSSVGKTTLYARNSQTKEYIHGPLLKELDEKIANIFDPRPNIVMKTSSKIKIEEKNKEIKELKFINSQLLAQIVTLENSFENTAHLNYENYIQDIEINLYIVSSLLNRQIGGYKKLNNIIKNFEVKFHGSKILLEAKDQLQRMQNDIKCFNIISITGSIKDS